MIKKLFFLSIAALSTPSIAATNCHSYVSFPANSVTLNCYNNNCSGWTNSQSVYANGSCDNSVSFSAQAYISSTYVSGYCNNGFVYINSYTENLALRGQCSDGTAFNGWVYTPSSSASGSCSENGMITIFFSGGSQSASGSCQ